MARSPGPVYGVAIQLVKNLLHLPFGSSACVGELSNFLLGATFALIAGIIYKKHKNRSGALWGSVAGAAAMALISLPLNYFIVYPAYVVLYGLPLEAIVGMYQEILGTVAQIPTGNALFNCLLVFNVPFTPVQGPSGRGAVLPDLQAPQPPAAQVSGQIHKSSPDTVSGALCIRVIRRFCWRLRGRRGTPEGSDP